jgi:dihydrofolate reductase
MRSIFLHIVVSLDGFIEDEQGNLDWHPVDSAFETYSNEMLDSIGGMILGRKIFELFESYWPTAGENPLGAADQKHPEMHKEAAKVLNVLPKYVVSSTLKASNWSPVSFISNHMEIEVEKLKSEPGKDLAVFGGAELANSLLQSELLDEIRILVSPVLLGKGKRLFQENLPRIDLDLIETRKFDSGLIILRYKVKK